MTFVDKKKIMWHSNLLNDNSKWKWRGSWSWHGSLVWMYDWEDKWIQVSQKSEETLIFIYFSLVADSFKQQKGYYYTVTKTQLVPQFQISIPSNWKWAIFSFTSGLQHLAHTFHYFCLVGLVTFHYSLSLLFFDVIYQLALMIIHKQQNQSGHLVTTLNPTRIYFFLNNCKSMIGNIKKIKNNNLYISFCLYCSVCWSSNEFYYLPIQNLAKMEDKTSSETSWPLIWARAKAASLSSIVQKSIGSSSLIASLSLSNASFVRTSCSHCLWYTTHTKREINATFKS